MSIKLNKAEYKIVKELGKGGSGKVFQVQKDNKYYALKEIQVTSELKDKIEEIQKEAKILSKFNSKYIVKYYDSYLYKDKFYILMEYCSGLNLKEYINKNKNKLIEENILYNIIKQICLGIKEIHEKKIVHRDLKPENIFLNEKMELKIGDFGIAKEFSSNKEFSLTQNQRGSLYYMAPEIQVEKIYSKKSDIYSLGCIIYELFTLSVYYFDYFDEEIKKLNSNIYNNKWQKIINSLLEVEYNKRMDINQVYEYIELEKNINSINIEKENIIKGEIYINKDNINKDIQIINSFENVKRQIINSFENVKRQNHWKDKPNEYEYKNEEEIKENIVIKINGEIIKFTYFYKFKKEGKYIIEYKFKNDLTKANNIFFNCKTLTNINLSNFNTNNATNMNGMFCGCSSLTNINLSNFNTNNVTNMNAMFYRCKKLIKKKIIVKDIRILSNKDLFD